MFLSKTQTDTFFFICGIYAKKGGMNLEQELSDEGNQRQTVKEKVRQDYDLNTLYICMKLEL